MTKENKNINLIPNEKFDIIPYYKVADILVSDISSTLFEFYPKQANYSGRVLYSKIKTSCFQRF